MYVYTEDVKRFQILKLLKLSKLSKLLRPRSNHFFLLFLFFSLLHHPRRFVVGTCSRTARPFPKLRRLTRLLFSAAPGTGTARRYSLAAATTRPRCGICIRTSSSKWRPTTRP